MEMPIFEKHEYLERIEKTKYEMERAGIEVLVVVDPANMNYLTGYDAWSFYTPQLVIVNLEQQEPIWIGRKMDVACAKFTVWLSSENIIGYPEDVVNHQIKHPMSYISSIIKERGLGNKIIGIEKEAYYFDIRSYEELTRNLPDARFKDARMLVNWIRSIKSDQEIKYMKEAGDIITNVMKIAIEKANVGIRECDVVADILHAQASGTEKFGGDYTSLFPLIFQGEKASTPHLSWSDSKIQNETAVLFELAGCRHRYHTPMARTLYLGSKPPRKLIDTAEIVNDGLNTVFDFIKPGKTCEEVELEWRKIISKAGLTKESRMGYPIGLAYPPVWCENTMSMRPGDRTVLKKNMTFHVLVAMWMDGWGYTISEPTWVTEKGCESFAHFARKLFMRD
jgi:Xaa-Pro dipeptidase